MTYNDVSPVSTIEFEAFPKIARLNRDMIITEKLDGTNGAIVIVKIPFDSGAYPDYNRVAIISKDETPDYEYLVYVQSRNKFITPGKATDNFGFAGWVHRNAESLVKILGEGRHYGEWWGSGIQRKYGLTGSDKRFSLFNVTHWADTDFSPVPGLGVVPTLYVGKFNSAVINAEIGRIHTYGSLAVPGFMQPEGIAVFHTASQTMFKVTIDGDDAPKGAAGHALDYDGLQE